MTDFSPAVAALLQKALEIKGLAPDSPEAASFKQDIMERVNMAVFEHIPADKLPELENLLDEEGGEEKIAQFIKENVPQAEEIVSNIINHS